MYIRMFIVMIVTLYTSRIILQQLGIDDYGIYSVIGGLVTLFTFINQALSTSTQRYITFEMGKSHGDVSKIFSVCLEIHIYVSLVIIIIAETIGLWFVNNKMVFPSGSYNAVNWTYQFSILICVLSVIRVPYNALVLSHERMSFYAINSIIETILKLIIVYLLMIVKKEKLIFYMIFLTIVTVLISLWYIIYCKLKFKNIKFVSVKDKSYYYEIIKFSGWATFGSLANVGYQQGVMVIVNIFYGVIINAAIGIANQVNSAVSQFVSGFQQALNPQLIKTEASHNTERQYNLISISSKFSFIIMLVIAYPLLCNINYILKLWLGEYPEDTGIISSLIIIGALLESLSGPLWVTIYATGKIRLYQIIISFILILNVPLAYFIGKNDFSVWYVYLFRILLFFVALATRLIFLKKMISFKITNFIKKVLLPLFFICILLIAFSFLFLTFFQPAQNFIELIYQSLLYFFIALLLVYFIGLTKSEIDKFKSIILSKLHL